MFILYDIKKGDKSIQLSIRHFGKEYNRGNVEESVEKPQVCGEPVDESGGEVEDETGAEEQEQEAEKC